MSYWVTVDFLMYTMFFSSTVFKRQYLYTPMLTQKDIVTEFNNATVRCIQFSFLLKSLCINLKGRDSKVDALSLKVLNFCED